MADVKKYFVDPNGPAYRKEELRSGSPLAYVAEKQRYALVELHALTRTLPESKHGGDAESGESTHDEGPLVTASRQARHALVYQYTAFLALYNMLGAASGANLLERLIAMDGDEFDRWLEFVEREGSVLGV